MELQSTKNKVDRFKSFLSPFQLELEETKEEITRIQKILRGGIVKEEEVFTRRIKFLMDKEAGIEKTLENIKKGSYGICKTCRESISPKRLKALPHTKQCTLCVSAASNRKQ